MTDAVVPTALHDWLTDGREIALLDVREEGQHGSGHPLLAVNLPYSRLERDAAALVPRRGVRVVLLDDGDGVAARAARGLDRLGYRDVSILEGGAPAWAAAGYALFESTNVPSKAFAEVIEHAFATPHIAAAELQARLDAKEDVTILDSRTVEEFTRFHVPGAISCPGVELVHRFADLVPSSDTFVVVSCAGRTRGIIGAQALIDAGVPNRVAALAGGTQGWRLAGLELERQVPAQPGTVSPQAASVARTRAAAIAERTGVPHTGLDTVTAWHGDDSRTTYILDVRTPAEFAAGHLPAAVSAQGGQLVQAIDRWVGTRGARLVLTDDDGVRATLAGHWLKQMGWEVHVLPVPAGDKALVREPAVVPAVEPVVDVLDPDTAAAWISASPAAISVAGSAAYRKAHPAGAAWTTRARLQRLPPEILNADAIVIFAEEEDIGQLAAVDLRELTKARIGVAASDEGAWRAAGITVVSSETPEDPERIDYLFWNHDRHDGNATAMRAYLQWETELPARIATDGTAGFKIRSASSATA